MSPCPSDIKYALIGTALGVAISAGFLALKICMIRKHLLDYDSADLRSANVGVDGKDTGAQPGLWTCSRQPPTGTQGHCRALGREKLKTTGCREI